MRHDLISDVFTIIKNAEAVGKKECIVPASKLVKSILKVMQKHEFIGNFEYIDDGKGGKFRIELLGKINECKSIRPRFSVKKEDFIKFEKRFLPSFDIGILILTTDKGIIDNIEAKEKGIGGKLLGYVY